MVYQQYMIIYCSYRVGFELSIDAKGGVSCAAGCVMSIFGSGIQVADRSFYDTKLRPSAARCVLLPIPFAPLAVFPSAIVVRRRRPCRYWYVSGGRTNKQLRSLFISKRRRKTNNTVLLLVYCKDEAPYSPQSSFGRHRLWCFPSPRPAKGWRCFEQAFVGLPQGFVGVQPPLP